MKVLSNTGLTGAALALLMALVPTQAIAQDAPDQEELRTFTEAYVQIADVRAEMTPELAAAETPEEANQIQEQANNRMTEILDQHGLDVERYSEITAVLNSDEELRAEFEQLYSEIGGG